jgi:hypothetical protein
MQHPALRVVLIQFESTGTALTNDVIVLADHWPLWERV